MSWNTEPAQIKSITPTDFTKANILSTDSWEKAGGSDRMN